MQKAGFCHIKRLKIRSYFPLLIMIFLGLILRLLLMQYLTYFPDLLTYQFWSWDLINYGFKSFYEKAVCDYLPMYLYILWFIGKVYSYLNTKLFYIRSEFIYKLPPICADIGNTVLVFLISQKLFPKKNKLVLPFLYLFNPAIFFISTFWGQSESVVTFFLLLSFLLLIKKKFLSSLIVLALAQSVKPIAVIVLPYCLVFMLKEKLSRKKLFINLIIPLVIYLAVFMPFADNRNLIGFIITRNFFTADFWQYVTLNAFNFWAFVMGLFMGGIEKILVSGRILFVSFQNWGRILFLAVYLPLLFSFTKKISKVTNKPRLIVNYIAVSFISMFLFLTSFHERHIFYGLVFLLLGFWGYSKFGKILTGVSFLVFLLNMIYAYNAAGILKFNLPIWSIIILSSVNIFILLYFIKTFTKPQ